MGCDGGEPNWGLMEWRPVRGPEPCLGPSGLKPFWDPVVGRHAGI